MNHLSAYLTHKGFQSGIGNLKYFTTQSNEYCDKYKKKFKQGEHENGYPVRLEKENVDNWYPKTFSERIDLILLYFNSLASHVGEKITIKGQKMISCTFTDRYDYANKKQVKQQEIDILAQVNYILKYLYNTDYIEDPIYQRDLNKSLLIKLTPKSYDRIDKIQKNMSTKKNVLIAMKFGEETKKLREGIRKGIQKTGYVPIFIDEVEHNDFITPELLKYIRDSKFVVVDLTHKNNGAYFEEGYAMGLGKPVIQLCKKNATLHFDIAQKNTIIWETEDEIPERLKNRIIATID